MFENDFELQHKARHEIRVRFDANRNIVAAADIETKIAEAADAADFLLTGFVQVEQKSPGSTDYKMNVKQRCDQDAAV
jgi:hypothetical protein